MCAPALLCGYPAPTWRVSGGVLGIALTEIDYTIPSDKAAKSLLSFGADVVKSETNIWGNLGNGGLGWWSVASEAENQHL